MLVALMFQLNFVPFFLKPFVALYGFHRVPKIIAEVSGKASKLVTELNG